MRRILSTALLLSIAACSSNPTPAVQNAPPAPATEPAPVADAGPVFDDATAAPDAPVAAAPMTTPDLAVTMPDAGVVAPTPPTPPHHPTPVAGNEVARGRAVFQRVCARCHEDESDPDGPSPNKRWAEARMRNLIRNGNARMRAIPVARMSDDDLVLLVSYLRSTHAIQ